MAENLKNWWKRNICLLYIGQAASLLDLQCRPVCCSRHGGPAFCRGCLSCRCCRMRLCGRAIFSSVALGAVRGGEEAAATVFHISVTDGGRFSFPDCSPEKESLFLWDRCFDGRRRGQVYGTLYSVLAGKTSPEKLGQMIAMGRHWAVDSRSGSTAAGEWRGGLSSQAGH